LQVFLKYPRFHIAPTTRIGAPFRIIRRRDESPARSAPLTCAASAAIKLQAASGRRAVLP
jgi:hypothetical protein